MKHALIFALSLFFFTSANAQFRMVGTGSWTTVNDSTYSSTLTFNADLTGNGYLATQILQDSFRVFTGLQKIYRIDTVYAQTFSSATMVIVEYGGTQGAPSGQVMIYNPNGQLTVPQVPIGSTGSTAQLQAAVVTYNAANGGSGSSITTGDKGDIDVVGADSDWRIDTGAVTLVKMASNSVDSTKIVSGGLGITDASAALITHIRQPGVDSTTAHRTDITNLQTLSGRPDGSTHNGTYTGSTITDNQTTKQNIQQLETAVEAKDGSVTNEGALSVGAAGAGTSQIITNTSGDGGVILKAGTNISLSESADTITITASGGGGGAGIDTLYNYTALRAYTGSANAVYLNATGVSGLFRRVPTGTENYGTLIAASNGIKWARDWDGVNLYLDWFNTVVGDSITDDQAALQAIFTNVVGHGYTIHGNPNKIYLIKDQILTGRNVSLKNVNLKRGNGVKTELTSTALEGADFIVVNNTAGFTVGRNIAVIDTTSTYGGKGDSEINIGLTIESISNDTIYLTGTISLPDDGNLDGLGYFPIGSPVIIYHFMLRSGGWKLNLYECKLNGNRDNNDFTDSWRVNLAVHNPEDNSRFENCEFYEMPGEMMYALDGFMSHHNYYHDCDGSAVHISSGLDNVTIISNNRFERMNQADLNIAEHNDAVITGSSSAKRVIISDNVAVDCGNGFAGKVGDGDFGWVITGNYIENADFLFLGSGASGSYVYDVMIANNICKGCGGIEMQMSNWVRTNKGFDGLTIANNELYDAKIYLYGVSNVKITNNIFNYSSYPDTAGFSVNMDSIPGLINFDYCTGIDVSGNTMEYMLPNPDEVRVGIRYTPTGIDNINIDSLTTTRFSYSSSYFKIDNNKILGFPIGISDSRADSSSYLNQYLGFDVTNNIITLHDSTEARYGIRCTPGMNVRNNTIFGNTRAEYGLQVIGCRSTDTALVSGPWVSSNRVEGIAVSARIGPAGSTYAAQVNNNLFSGTISDNSGGNSTVEFNKAILQKTIPLQRIRMNPTWY